MNKYLIKIASKSETETALTPEQKAGLGIGVSGYGLHTMRKEYHGGGLTGRQTLYHGTSDHRADTIRKEGLKPNLGHEGVSGKLSESLVDKNKNLVFATKSGLEAQGYALQQRAIDSGRIKSRDGLIGLQRNPQAMGELVGNTLLGRKKGIVKINAPTHLPELKGVTNPEVKHWLRNSRRNLMFILQPNMARKFQKYSTYKALTKNVHVVRGPDGIRKEHIVGSDAYKPNSLPEFKSYATGNRNRFLKSIGKTGLGLGVAGAGAALAINGYKSRVTKTA